MTFISSLGQFPSWEMDKSKKWPRDRYSAGRDGLFCSVVVAVVILV